MHELISDDIDTNKSGNLTNVQELREIQHLFPTGIDHAFGYGSGVFTQISSSIRKDNANDKNSGNLNESTDESSKELPMLDLIISVNDSNKFHAENLSLHPHHYSSIMSSAGPDFVSWVQCCNLGAKVYFNPLVSVTTPSNNRDRMIKYGVVSTSDLVRDLEEWEFLYLAGRMQKPTLSIEKDDQVYEAQQNFNLKYAMSASLLLLSDMNDELENGILSKLPISTIFEQIARLSYTGDPRMAVGGEDPRKVEKLVHSPGQINRFYDLYKNQFDDLQNMGLLSIASSDKNDLSKITPSSFQVEFNHNDPSSRKALWERLPRRLRSKREASILGNAIASIVAPAARGQSVKGVLTAGITRSIKYAGAKFAKGWNMR